MYGSARREVVFSEHASISLFECLIVAGAPATGLLQDTAFDDGGTLQLTLQLLRDMWQRADTMYVPRADLESLHRLECKSTTGHEAPIADQISTEARKLSRYYVYLLFRYCMSTACPATYVREGFTCAGSMGRSHWEPAKHAAPSLVDVPASWLETRVCSTYPSAPPAPEGNFASGFPGSLPQRLPTIEREQHPPQQHDPQQQQQRAIDRTEQRAPVQSNKHGKLYPSLAEHHFSAGGLSRNKPFKGTDVNATKPVFPAECYESNIESEDEY